MGNRYFPPILILLLLLTVQAATAEKTVLQDPLRPARYQAPAEVKTPTSAVKSWHLSAILRSEARSVAVINGQAVQVGEILDGYKVVKIEPGKVVLTDKKKTIVLRRAGTGLKNVSSSQGVEKGRRP